MVNYITKAISFDFAILVIIMPISKHFTNNIKWNNYIKKFLGIVICVFEVWLIIWFFYDVKTYPPTNIFTMLLALLFGVIESVLSTFIRNYRNRKFLLKLLINLSVGRKSIVKEMLHDIISCGIEEIVWRGVVQEQIFIQQELLAVVLTSFAFTASHIKRRMYFSDMLEIFIISFALGVIMIFTKNIFYCFAFHWARNCTIDIINYNINKEK